MTKTWGQQNDEAAARVAAFFAEAKDGETFTAAQAGYLAGAKFVAYTDGALGGTIGDLVESGAIVAAGWRAGHPVYRRGA